MKTPRLALLALLLTPAAYAGMPTPWTVVDESYRSWPTVSFNDGKANRSLRCRYAECDPAKNKGKSNLYTMTQVGAPVPFKATVYDFYPLGKYDPRRLVGDADNKKGYKKVARVVDAVRTTYKTELSNFSLDNSGKGLAVVQGTASFPARTDINEEQISGQGNAVNVRPPTTMADDVIKPKPAGKPGNGTNTHHGTPAVPLGTTWWCNKTTGDKLSVKKGKKAPAGYEKLASRDSACTIAGAPVTSPVVVAGPPALIDDETRWLTKFQHEDYAARRKDAKDDAARTALDAEYRALVKAQIRPEAAAGYASALAAPPAEMPKKVMDAIGKTEMWGGEVKAVVAPFQEKADPATAKLLEIQLSKADWDLLSKLVDGKFTPARIEYQRSRGRLDGSSKLFLKDSPNAARAFEEAYFDPVALHLGVEAALKAIGKTAVQPVVTKPEGDAAVAPLTDAEMKLLTPAELQAYNKLLENVKNKVPGAEKSLALESDRLRKLIAAEKRGESPAYAPPKDLEAFNKLPNWHKDIFCDPKTAGSAIAATGPKKSETQLNTGAANVDTLKKKAEQLAAEQLAAEQTAAAQSSAPLPDWAKGPCAAYLAGKTQTSPGGNTNTNNSGVGGNIGEAKTAIAVDKETDAKKKSEWLTQDLLVSGAKGAMVGLLIGSLLGPIGLIAGPLIGAALFYGLTKIMG